MMGCTDRHCRYLFRLLSPNAMLYSEMVTTGALIHGDTDRLLAHVDDAPCAVQLGGSNPAELTAAARMVEEAGYQEVNLNCGCPSDRVQQGGIGACLMAEADLVAECYQAMADTVSIPVTIKSRIGIDDQDGYSFFQGFIDTIYQAGCRSFQVHARKAILSGLSPKDNREIPPLKYDYVRRIQLEYPDAAFVLNGGIRTVEEALSLTAGYSGIMLGRAPYANPFLLAELEQALFGTETPDQLEVLHHFLDYAENAQHKGTHIRHMAKHLLGLFTGIRGARAYRRYLSENMFAEDADVSVVRSAVNLVSRDSSDTGT